jgi:DNA-binding XRE family transcriptional regulator
VRLLILPKALSELKTSPQTTSSLEQKQFILRLRPTPRVCNLHILAVSRIDGAWGDAMTEMLREQLGFGDGLIGEEVSDPREDWVAYADQVLADAPGGDAERFFGVLRLRPRRSSRSPSACVPSLCTCDACHRSDCLGASCTLTHTGKPLGARRSPRMIIGAKKAPNPVDKHVGSRVRMRRKMLNMTQEKLGDCLGITFQQVQKYEKGTNRIGASRLRQAARILQVPVPFFFEGARPGGSTRMVARRYRPT